MLLISENLKVIKIIKQLDSRYNGNDVIPAKAGIQTPSLRKQGTIKSNWIPVFTGNPGFRIKCGMTDKGNISYSINQFALVFPWHESPGGQEAF